MNTFAATYVVFVQVIGALVIFGVAAYAIKQMVLKLQQPIDEPDIGVEVTRR
ncbi:MULTISPECIES: hypothetical protein [Prochlorococcus]|uniref:hypothetical protein n=1 Tax=Prochlorococcus TaxID=1218 RepID=UPI0007BB2297|nr:MULTISPECIES: hypothetical protein [Prochlorococcus]KZR66451.1 hypothetical protein PMIT1312_00916 [Prochlorococcus marinus str. MIT 1312]NMO83155.1 hypothetical protein [Prochlorococcus sp. P1344]NMP06157.1 hypothetical protein [Prochlorococcus sp. P1361]NMP12304.1 hypothetical protein [Prochlorococcus sp.P1363]